MIDKEVTDTIKTGVELNAYFLANLEIGDSIKGPSGLLYTVVGRSSDFFWCQHDSEFPVTLTVRDMDV